MLMITINHYKMKKNNIIQFGQNTLWSSFLCQSANKNNSPLVNARLILSLSFTALLIMLSNAISATPPPAPCSAHNTMTVSNLKAFWVNAGANDKYTFYHGIISSKDFTAKVTGGVGPYTYSWSNSGGYTLIPDPSLNKIRLWEPTGPTWMKVTITDIGAGCTFKDSVFINWTDKYVASKAVNGPYTYYTCRNFKTELVTGFANLKSKIIAGTHALGACVTCAASANFNLYGLNPLWVNAGANDPNMFYHGVTQWKRIRAVVSGGVGPYNYVWSNSKGYSMQSQSGNQISIFEPLGPSYAICTITDIGANCTFKDSVFIDWTDKYYCGDASEFYKLKMCQSGVNVCMPWAQAKAALQASTATLGYCSVPKTDLTSNTNDFTVYPNPTTGVITISMPISQNSIGEVLILDVNGRRVYTENVSLLEGVFEHSLNLNNLPNGMYFLQLISQREVQTQRIQVLK